MQLMSHYGKLDVFKQINPFAVTLIPCVIDWKYLTNLQREPVCAGTRVTETRTGMEITAGAGQRQRGDVDRSGMS